MDEKDISILLVKLHRQVGSWRLVQEKYYPAISSGSLAAYAKGRPVKNKAHRHIFRLPHYVVTEACPICGAAPTVCLCDGKRVVKPSKKGKQYPRRAIRLDDPESAARSLIGADVTTEYLHRLAELIKI
jgi:hypothetical protein